MTARDAVADLRAIAFALERAGEAAYRVKAFRKAADAVGALPADEVTRRAGDGTLTTVPGIGEVTARCVDSDAHAPGQLDWLRTGCERAARCGVRSDRIVNTWPVAELLAWAGGHGTRRRGI